MPGERSEEALASALGRGHVARATAWRFAYLGSQAGLGLALFVSLAQALPTDAFAKAALAQAVLVIAQALGDFGLSQAAVVVLPARLARNPDARREVLSGAAAAFLLAGGLALVLTALALLAVPASARVPTLLVAPAAVASVLVSGADGLLRSTGEFRRPVGLVVMSRAGAFAALPAALVSDSAAWAVAGLSVGTVAFSVPALRVLLAARRGHPGAGAGGMFRAAIPLGAAQAFILAAGRLNTVILSTLLSLRAAAAFEGAWRLFQLGQYAAGGLSTGAAPFVGHAVGAADHRGLRELIGRLTVILAVAGLLFGIALAIVGPPASRVLLGEIGDDVGDVLLPFAVLSPFAFVGFLAFTALSASERHRRLLVIAYGVGAVVGLSLVLLLARRHGLPGATTGCAIGWGIAQLIMIRGLVHFLREPAGRPDTEGIEAAVVAGPEQVS